MDRLAILAALRELLGIAEWTLDHREIGLRDNGGLGADLGLVAAVLHQLADDPEDSQRDADDHDAVHQEREQRAERAGLAHRRFFARVAHVDAAVVVAVLRVLLVGRAAVGLVVELALILVREHARAGLLDLRVIGERRRRDGDERHGQDQTTHAPTFAWPDSRRARAERGFSDQAATAAAAATSETSIEIFTCSPMSTPPGLERRVPS